MRFAPEMSPKGMAFTKQLEVNRIKPVSQLQDKIDRYNIREEYLKRKIEQINKIKS